MPNQQITPRMEQCAIRMGLNEPFQKASAEMAFQHRINLSAETIRTRTEEIGQIYERVQAEQAEQLQPQPSTPRMFVSVDAAKLQTSSGEWRDVKTLVIGNVAKDGKIEQSSYFSRLCEYSDFSQRAQVEVKRRNLKQAQQVVAVHDGADWVASVISACRPDAMRILDFWHAVEHVAEVGRAVYGQGSQAFSQWFDKQRHALRDGEVNVVLQTLSELSQQHPEHAVLISNTLAYLTKRIDMIQYADFKAQGWPIGSGPAETCHKTILQARMKRAGMRWSVNNINPFVAARNLLGNKRWESDWSLIHALRLKRPLPSPQPDHAKPSLLPAGFALKPAIPWRNRPVGNAISR